MKRIIQVFIMVSLLSFGVSSVYAAGDACGPGTSCYEELFGSGPPGAGR